jgi:hypothetical protein
MEGGQAHMVGGADSTIVMTGYGDDFRDLACFGPGVKGMWGGLIIKGLAKVSDGGYHSTYPKMEGIAGYQPDSIKTFGKGSNDADNSGEYAYLSIRHGGAGRATNSEINGISLYGVGSGTTMHHIEVMSNYDDAIEFFGGAVNLKYVCNSFCDDDQFDIDEGYRGKMQYLFSVELNWMGNRCGEWDGMKHFADPNPTSSPTICNLTQIGCGKYTANVLALDTGTENQNYGARFIWQLADSLKGDYRNVVALDQARWAFWMRNHDLAPFGQAPIGNANGPKWSGVMVYHTRNTTANDNTEVWSNLVFDDNGQAAASVAWLTNAANKCFCNVDPQLRGVSREFNFPALDPRPCVGSPALNSAAYVANPSDGFFDATNYVGAFSSSNLWCDGWTKLSQMGCLSSYMSTFPENAVVPSNASFDVCYNINDPTAVPTGVAVTLDGVDVTSAVIPAFLANNGAMPCGGTYLKIPSVPASALAGVTGSPVYNYFGLHTLKTAVTLADGRVLNGITRLKVSN